jgi:hypothetical protein
MKQFVGNVCVKHPILGGLRYGNRGCVACHKERASIAVKQWRADNPDKTATQRRSTYSRRKAKYIEEAAQRKATKMQATPVWRDHEKIDTIYALAKIYRDAGIDCHVDHEVMLKSEFVCGLHTETNLALPPGSLNMSKGNRYWSDQPESTK